MTKPTARPMMPAQARTFTASLALPLPFQTPTGAGVAACAIVFLPALEEHADLRPRNPNTDGLRGESVSGSLSLRGGAVLGVNGLKRPNGEFAALQRGDALGCGARGGQRSDRGNACHHCGASNRLLVEPGFEASGSVDDELNPLALNEVDNIGASFFHFVDAFHVHACGFNDVSSPGGGDH